MDSFEDFHFDQIDDTDWLALSLGHLGEQSILINDMEEASSSLQNPDLDTGQDCQNNRSSTVQNCIPLIEDRNNPQTYLNQPTQNNQESLNYIPPAEKGTVGNDLQIYQNQPIPNNQQHQMISRLDYGKPLPIIPLVSYDRHPKLKEEAKQLKKGIFCKFGVQLNKDYILKIHDRIRKVAGLRKYTRIEYRAINKYYSNFAPYKDEILAHITDEIKKEILDEINRQKKIRSAKKNGWR